MDRRLFAFLVLIGVLVLAQVYMVERFYGGSATDSSGSSTDSSGSTISLSMADLLKLLSASKPPPAPTPAPSAKPAAAPSGDMLYDATGDIYYSSLKGDIIDQIKSSVHKEVAANRTLLVGGAPGGDSSSGCGCESFADMQGQQIIRKKGVDYIRTDSIPCYACSLK